MYYQKIALAVSVCALVSTLLALTVPGRRPVAHRRLGEATA